MVRGSVLSALLTGHCDTFLVLDHQACLKIILLVTKSVLDHNLDLIPVRKLDLTDELAANRDLNPRREIDSIFRGDTTAG